MGHRRASGTAGISTALMVALGAGAALAQSDAGALIDLVAGPMRAVELKRGPKTSTLRVSRKRGEHVPSVGAREGFAKRDTNLGVNEASQVREWVQAWKRAEKAMGEVKRQEVRRMSTARALEQLEDYFRYALRNARPTRTSGLVEQQRIFKTLRHG